MRFRSSRSPIGGSRYVSYDEIRTNLRRYNQKVNRQKYFENKYSGDWDDHLDPGDRADLMDAIDSPRHR